MRGIDIKIWINIEKLQIRCKGPKYFIELARKNNILIDEYGYRKLDQSFWDNGLGTRFSYLMEFENPDKYEKIISETIFDEVIFSQKDGPHDDIKKWYNDVIKILSDHGVEIDNENQKIIIPQEKIFDLLEYPFDDPMIDKILNEINVCYSKEQYLAVLLLTRKIIETVFIKVLKKTFPRNIKKAKFEEIIFALLKTIFPKKLHGFENNDCSIWFNDKENKPWNLGTILKNVSTNNKLFGDDKHIIKDACILIQPIKDELNAFAHRESSYPNEDTIEELEIREVLTRLRDIYKTYCSK